VREPLLVTRQIEGDVLEEMLTMLKVRYPELNPSNTVVLMVSPDYSATVAMHMAHKLSKDGEMCDLMMVDVPFPDQQADWFMSQLRRTLTMSAKTYDNYVLAEAGIIRGGNYTWICDLMKDYIPSDSRIITTALFENVHSKFKSDVVGEYYDDKTQDLTFYYEEYNKHWD
jgi:hypothetical protein